MLSTLIRPSHRVTLGWLVLTLLVAISINGLNLLASLYLNLASLAVVRSHVVLDTDSLSPPAKFNTIQIDSSLRFAQSALAYSDNDAPAWRQIGHARRLAGQVGSANMAYIRSLHANPDDFISRDALASLYASTGQFNRAIVEWRKLSAPARLVSLGDRLLEQARWREALNAYEAVIEETPGYIEAYYPLGWIQYRYLGDVSGALETFLRARELNPSSPWPYVNTGDLYAAEGQIKEAIQWYLRAREVAPREPGLDVKVAWGYTTYAGELLDAEQWDPAEIAFSRAVEVMPTYLPAYHGLAKLAWKGRQDPASALEILQQAIDLDPSDIRSYLLLENLLSLEYPDAR